MAELDALGGDQELWCALAELYVGREEAEEAECVFAKEESGKRKKGKKFWSVNLSGGANLDTAGDLKNKFAKAVGKLWDFSGQMRIRENKGIDGIAAFRHGFFMQRAVI